MSPAAATATATAAALAWATPFKHLQRAAAAGGLLLATKLQSGYTYTAEDRRIFRRHGQNETLAGKVKQKLCFNRLLAAAIINLMHDCPYHKK